MISMVDTIGKIENSFIHNGFSSGHEAISISVNSELFIQNYKINNIYLYKNVIKYIYIYI